MNPALQYKCLKTVHFRALCVILSFQCYRLYYLQMCLIYCVTSTDGQSHKLLSLSVSHICSPNVCFRPYVIHSAVTSFIYFILFLFCSCYTLDVILIQILLVASYVHRNVLPSVFLCLPLTATQRH